MLQQGEWCGDGRLGGWLRDNRMWQAESQVGCLPITVPSDNWSAIRAASHPNPQPARDALTRSAAAMMHAARCAYSRWMVRRWASSPSSPQLRSISAVMTWLSEQGPTVCDCGEGEGREVRRGEMRERGGR